MCRTTTGHLCWWTPVPLWREARDKLKLPAAGSTTITEVTLPPSCSCSPLLLLKEATSGGAAAAAGTASVTIPNYLLQAFSIFASRNPLSSSLSPPPPSSQYCSATPPTFSTASFLKNLFPKKSTKPKFQNAIPTTVHTTLFAIEISATNKWIMSLKQKQRSFFSATNKTCVRVRVCACPLQQNRLIFSLQQPQK